MTKQKDCVQYERLRPGQVVKRRKACPVAYLPIGTIEWHGVHNPVGLDTLKIDVLRRRIQTESIKEVILALNSDVESDATASMLNDLLNGMGISVSRPAMGMPAGSGIAFIDRITLNNAIQNRRTFQTGGKKEEGRRQKAEVSSQKSE